MLEKSSKLNRMKAKHILITGGAGFLGSHLCKNLLNEGHRITCVDNLYTGRIENIGNFLSNKNFSFIEHDIQLPLIYEGVIDEIYNLACPASPIHYQADPIDTAKTNFLGALNMLELARKKIQKYFKHPLVRYTEIHLFIPNQRITGVMLIQSALGLVMTKAKECLKHYFQTTEECMA